MWLAPLDGGRAWRVSADNVPVTHPRISPDGTTVAWTSTRDGAPEVHIAPVDGGPAKRLTYWGSWQHPGARLDPGRPGPGAHHPRPGRACAAAGRAPSRSTAARPPPCRTGRSATSPTARAPCCCPRRWAARPPGGSGTGAARRASCGSTGSGDGRVRTAARGAGREHRVPAVGRRTGSRSCPTTRASARSTPPSPTAPTCGGTHPLDGFYARHAATDGTRVVLRLRR